jgi:hypothetical protein
MTTLNVDGVVAILFFLVGKINQYFSFGSFAYNNIPTHLSLNESTFHTFNTEQKFTFLAM